MDAAREVAAIRFDRLAQHREPHRIVLGLHETIRRKHAALLLRASETICVQPAHLANDASGRSGDDGPVRNIARDNGARTNDCALSDCDSG